MRAEKSIKMNFLIQSCVFVLILHGALSDTDDNSIDSFKKEIMEGMEEIDKQIDQVMKEKCLKVGGKRAFQKFSQARQDLQVCLKDVGEIDEADLPSRICGEKRPQIRACFDNSITGLNKCFDEDDKWFVNDFFIGSFNSLFDFLCTDVFTGLKELMSLEGFDCIATLVKNENAFDNATETCFVNAIAMTEDDTDLTKTAVCSGMKSMNKCIEKAIKEQCTTNDGIFHIFEGAAAAFEKSC